MATRVPIRRPEWLKIRLESTETLVQVRDTMRGLRLHTVCEEARCPNLHECWSAGTATFMILGDVCTRHCGFCSVGKGAPGTLDPEEPRHVAEAVRDLKIRHAVITSVNRDDLPDGGAGHFAETLAWTRKLCPEVTIEVLIPDFMGDWSALGTVLLARPEVLNHNIETVPRLYRSVRPIAVYDRSLELLSRSASWHSPEYPVLTKSGLMVGLGETREEVLEVLGDLKRSRVDIVTIGQYLNPTSRHIPVARFVTPAEFEDYRRLASELGFLRCEAGPLVRSSYHAERAVAKDGSP